jgi:predicted SAM-dependent methyltransferase
MFNLRMHFNMPSKGDSIPQMSGSEQNSGIRVQYGAGCIAPEGWLHYDASPSVWLERLPVIGPLIRVNENRFPSSVQFGDIVDGLPIEENSAQAVYASHVLEHLAYDEFWVALRNTYKMLKPGGVFRMIVPDLQERARRYLACVASNDPEASSRFLKECYLGQSSRPRSAFAKLRNLFGRSKHLWMWDEVSLSEALKSVGFVNVRRCKYGDASDPAFVLVEREDRFVDQSLEIDEIAMEGQKPSV